MHHPSVLDQARFIVTAGKMIHDRIIKIQACGLESENESTGISELSVAQIHAVSTIRLQGPVSITELSELLSVSPPSASVMVDRLVQKGLLIREHSTDDRRKVVVKISPKALEFIQRIEENILTSFIDLIEKVGPDTARKWCEVLERIKTVLETNQGNTSGKSAPSKC